MERIYSTRRWKVTRELALERDGRRCTVQRLLGGGCTDELHVHHIVPVSDGGPAYDLDNVGTSCSAHHPQWEALRRALVRRRVRVPERRRCPHNHRTAEARRLCEERLNRDLATAA